MKSMSQTESDNMNILKSLKNLLKEKLKILDGYLDTDIYIKAKRIKDASHESKFFNKLRRKINPAFIGLKCKIGFYKNSQLKLHLGCGHKHLNGFINIDFRKTGATDLVCDIRRLPYPDNSAALIETYHLIEHLNRHDFPIALKEWHRVLATGGKVVIECPDFDETVKQYLSGNEKRIDNIFGMQKFPGDAHQFGYNYKRLKQVLEEAGFRNVEQKTPQDYHTETEPCLRVECLKSNS